jgi:hypothetical protein
MPGQGYLSYDSDNRLVGAADETYAYTPDNKRVYKQIGTGPEYFYFYLGNRQLGMYSLGTNGFSLAMQNTFSWGASSSGGSSAPRVSSSTASAATSMEPSISRSVKSPPLLRRIE